MSSSQTCEKQGFVMLIPLLERGIPSSGLREKDHLAKMLVKDLNKAVDELEHSQLILNRQDVGKLSRKPNGCMHTVHAEHACMYCKMTCMASVRLYHLLVINSGHEKQRGISSVHDLVLPVLVEGALVQEATGTGCFSSSANC